MTVDVIYCWSHNNTKCLKPFRCMISDLWDLQTCSTATIPVCTCAVIDALYWQLISLCFHDVAVLEVLSWHVPLAFVLDLWSGSAEYRLWYGAMWQYQVFASRVDQRIHLRAHCTQFTLTNTTFSVYSLQLLHVGPDTCNRALGTHVSGAGDTCNRAPGTHVSGAGIYRPYALSAAQSPHWMEWRLPRHSFLINTVTLGRMDFTNYPHWPVHIHSQPAKQL